MRGLRRRGRAWRALVVALATCSGAAAMIAPATAQGARDPWPSTEPGHRSTLILGPGTRFPIARRITIGLDKSMLVELPVDMKDVIVSKPEVLDVTVLNPRQANLLAKGAGDANAFILGPDGQKLVLLEVTVARDLTPLADALARLLPGSRIRVEALGDSVVLTGSVIDPIDASRAADIAGRYARNKDAVVNMLAVGTKEQVLLKVQVAEMQRDAIRRIGVNLPGAILNSGNITFTKVIQNAFPVTASAVPGRRSSRRAAAS